MITEQSQLKLHCSLHLMSRCTLDMLQLIRCTLDMLQLTLLFALSSGFLYLADATDDIIVNLANGGVRGTTIESAEGQEYFAFLGIPYAEAPTGERRFKAPVAKKPWHENGTLDAKQDGPVCVQEDLLSATIIGTEDCLFVNVFTKDYLTEKKYPVMVWIHGGGFMYGSSSSWMYGPSRFIAEDVVVVSVNYRLDSLGFLSTNDDASPGNYGLLDQLEALKWVKENIDNFGGDVNQIILFGQSAGSASAFYHTLSPLSEGLLHKAIALSGTPLCPWAFEKKPQYWAEKLGKILNCPEDHHELVNCLREIPAFDIIKAAAPLRKQVCVPFPPVVDGQFITAEPHKVFEEGKIKSKVPLLMGIVKNEGAGMYALTAKKLVKYSEEILKEFIRKGINFGEDIPDVIDLVKQKYMKNYDVTNKVEFAHAISEVFSDSMVDVCGFETVKHLTKAGVKTQFYTFDFAANYSIINVMGIKEYLGVAHGDELWYLFDGKLFDNFMRSEKVKQIATKLVKLLTNFAKFGDATRDEDVKWPLSSPGNILVYHINEENHVEKYNPDDDPRTELWLKTVPKYIDEFENRKRNPEL